jgi:hypothetical protein
MQRHLVMAPAICAMLSTPASAELPPRFEIGLECVSAANVSVVLMKDAGAPQDMQESYAVILQSATSILHTAAPVANMTVEEVDREVIRRATVLIERINAVPDEGYEAALFQQISLQPGGGMAACTTLMDEAKADGLIP